MSLFAEHDRGEKETEGFGILKVNLMQAIYPGPVPTTKVTIFLMKTRRTNLVIQERQGCQSISGTRRWLTHASAGDHVRVYGGHA